MRWFVLLLVVPSCAFSISPSGAPAGASVVDTPVIGDGSVDAPADGVQLACTTNLAYAYPLDGSTYRLAASNNLLVFDDAAALCQTDGARLVVIETMAENEHLAARLLGFPDWSWIGLTDRAVEGTPVWITGAPLLAGAYRPFNGEIGDGAADCYNMSPSQISGQNGLWGNYFCDQPKGWICECDSTP